MDIFPSVFHLSFFVCAVIFVLFLVTFQSFFSHFFVVFLIILSFFSHVCHFIFVFLSHEGETLWTPANEFGVCDVKSILKHSAANKKLPNYYSLYQIRLCLSWHPTSTVLTFLTPAPYEIDTPAVNQSNHTTFVFSTQSFMWIHSPLSFSLSAAILLDLNSITATDTQPLPLVLTASALELWQRRYCTFITLRHCYLSGSKCQTLLLLILQLFCLYGRIYYL